MRTRTYAHITHTKEDTCTSTSETLREIKTVRQFAMESQEAANYARGELTRHMLSEKSNVLTEVPPPPCHMAQTRTRSRFNLLHLMPC